MAKRTTIAIPIEIKGREFNGKLLLAYKLAISGFKVICGANAEIYGALDLLSPDLVFISTGDYNERILRSLRAYKKRGGIVILAENEGGILINAEENLPRLDQRMLDVTDHYFAWGHVSKEIILKYRNFSPENIWVTGTPLFDTMTPRFRRLFESRILDVKRKHGDFVLINTNFGIYNHHLEGWGLDRFEDGRYEHNKALFDSFIEMINYLSENVNCKIVLRPHPSENKDRYVDIFGDRDNVHVIREGSVTEWNMAARVVVHNGSTSGFEAALNKKITLSYRKVKHSKFDIPLPNMMSKEFDGSGEITEFINRVFSNFQKEQEPDPVKQEEATKWILNCKNEAVPKYLEAIMQLTIGGYKGSLFKFLSLASYKEGIKPYVYGFLKLVFPTRAESYDYQFSKFSFLKKPEIESYFKDISNIEGLNPQIRVKKQRFFARTFSISSVNN